MLTPGKIYEEYKKNNIDKLSAADLLFSLIENSDKEKIRVQSINELEHIGVNDGKTFKHLEHLLISDSNEKVRNTAALMLRNLFLEKALEPMKWALKHEVSPLCLKTIYLTLMKIVENIVAKKNGMSKLILLTEIEKIENKEFKIGFESLRELRSVESFTVLELADILINYLTILFLKKTYWRLKFKIESCKITELDFIFKGLTHLPEAIKNLSSLKTLIFRYNQIFELPEWIGSLVLLEKLNFNVNNIKRLPQAIGSLTSLKILSLWKNEIHQLPETIGSLTSLEFLNLRINDLNALPNTIGNLTRLKELNLHDNKLEQLPDSIGSLFALEILNLSWNNLLELPETIGLLGSLEILDLERNELTSIPDSISSLKSLKILNLSDNKLIELPESLGSLISLKTLNISRNILKTIPKSLIYLPNLKEIYLTDNKLIDISNIVEQLEHKGVRVYN